MVFSLIWCLKRSSSRQSTCIDLVLLAKWFWKCCFRGKTKTFSAAETHLQKYYKTIRKFCFSHEIIQNDSVLQLKLFRMNSWVFISRPISVVLSWLEIFFFFHLHEKRKKENHWFHLYSGENKLRAFHFNFHSGKKSLKNYFNLKRLLKVTILQLREKLLFISVTNPNS